MLVARSVIWLPKMFLAGPAEARNFRKSDWLDLAIVYLFLTVLMTRPMAASSRVDH